MLSAMNLNSQQGIQEIIVSLLFIESEEAAAMSIRSSGFDYGTVVRIMAKLRARSSEKSVSTQNLYH